MTRRRLLLALLVVVAIFGVRRAPETVRQLIVTGLESTFRRQASVDEVRLHLFPFHAEVLGVRVAGARPGPPFLSIDRIVAVPSLAPLWGRRVVLARLSIERPVVRINAWGEGGDDIPRLSAGGGEGLDIRVRRLEVDQGELILEHERIPLSADLPDFTARLSARRAGVLFGHVAFAPGRVRFGSLPEIPLGTEFDVDADGLQLTIAAGHLRGDGTDLAYSGQLRLSSPPEARFVTNGRIDMGLLESRVIASGLGLDGGASYRGTVSFVNSELLAQGIVDGVDARVLGIPVKRFKGEVKRSDRGLSLHGLDAELLGGSCRLDVDVTSKPARVHLAGRVDGFDAEDALRAVFGYGAMGLAAGATGDIDLSWPRGRPREIGGRMGLDLAPRSDARAALSGRFDWSADKGVQQIERADLRTSFASVRLAGRIDVADRADLEVEAESPDLAAADLAAQRLRRALGTASADLTGVQGAGVFRGRWKGSLGAPVFEGRFSGRDIEYRGVQWGEAEWAGSASGDAIDSHSLVLRHAGAELWLDGHTETGDLGGRDALDVRARWTQWPALDFIRAFGWELDATGRISGDAAVTGRRSDPHGRLHVTAADGRFGGLPVTDLDVDTELRGAVTEAKAGKLRIGGGDVDFHGTLTGDVYDGALAFHDVAIDEALPEVAPGVRLGGRLSGDVTLSGTPARPTLEGQIASARLFLGDEGIGALSATLSASGDGNLGIDARVRSPRVDVTASGRVGLDAERQVAARITVSESSVDPFLRVLAPALPAAAGIVVSGQLDVNGPLSDPQRLTAEALVSQIFLALPDYPVKNAEPLLVRLAAGRATFSELQLAGEGTSLAISGSVGLRRDEALSVEARGDADLRALAAVTRRLRGRGAARLTLKVSGSRADPELDGRLEIEGAGLRARGFPQGVDGVRGSVFFSANGAHFENLHGTLGGGDIDLTGRFAYDAGRLGAFEIVGEGRSLTLRYPEGLRAKADAQLRLFGDASSQWLTGSIDVAQATWSRRYDFASELLATRRSALTPASLGGGLRYDVRIRAPGTLVLDNNLANLEARADLQLQGTSEAPVLLGRAEIDRGRVYFLGNTYVIRRGTIDFTNPQQIDPLFDIEAEARVRSYRVSLKMNGTLERIFPTLTSDPPLSAVQILNLLAGADESAVASLSQSQVDQTRLAASGAATLAAGRLSEEVGLERGAERYLGLNRFSIDPSVVRGGVTNPSARLTVGKRLTSDLNVLYSIDLRGADERLLSIEYTISDKLSVLLTGTWPGGLGFDLRLRHSR